MKIDVIKIVKIAGLVLSVAGTVATGWAGSKENERTLGKLVEDRFKDQ